MQNSFINGNTKDKIVSIKYVDVKVTKKKKISPFNLCGRQQ